MYECDNRAQFQTWCIQNSLLPPLYVLGWISKKSKSGFIKACINLLSKHATVPPNGNFEKVSVKFT